jgi:hypothetical protein
MAKKTTTVISQLENKWENIYWFARMLINNDKYGGIGSDNKLLVRLASTLKLVADENKSRKREYILSLQKETIKSILTDRFKNATSRKDRVLRLYQDLDNEIRDLQDMEIFIMTCESIMLPINNALENIPNDDKQYTLDIAKSYLELKGENGLSTILRLWDDLGVKGCLTAERTEIVKAFATLKVLLDDQNITQKSTNIILTAFVQEFERRAAQKRKGRAGGSLEDVTLFILDYFNIPSSTGPEHFQADIEVDKWVKTFEKWFVGISCKRTLRERWKQVSSADASLLSQHKIKYVYHIITFDEDLSDDKIALLGRQRHIFYLPDKSRILKRAKKNIGLRDYVRPISQLIRDLRIELK